MDVATAPDPDTAPSLMRTANGDGRPFEIAIIDRTIADIRPVAFLGRLRDAQPEIKLILSTSAGSYGAAAAGP